MTKERRCALLRDIALDEYNSCGIDFFDMFYQGLICVRYCVSAVRIRQCIKHLHSVMRFRKCSRKKFRRRSI